VVTPTIPCSMTCYERTYTVTATLSNGCSATATVIIRVVNEGGDGISGDCSNQGKVSICHIPPGDPSNAHVICIGTSAVPAHTYGPSLGPDPLSPTHKLDCIGPCPPCIAAGNCTYPIDYFSTATCGILPREQHDAASQLLSEDITSGNILENYPDPFKETTTLRFVMQTDTHVTLEVFDLTGKLLKVAFNDNVAAQQEVKVEFSGTDLTSGMYIYKLITPDDVQTGKMMLMKE